VEISSIVIFEAKQLLNGTR